MSPLSTKSQTTRVLVLEVEFCRLDPKAPKAPKGDNEGSVVVRGVKGGRLCKECIPALLGDTDAAATFGDGTGLDD